MNIDEYSLYIGNTPRIDVPQLLNRRGSLSLYEFDMVRDPYLTIKAEQSALTTADPNQSKSFEHARNHVRGSLNAIMHWIFKLYGLPRSGGVDFGCGQLGEMVNKWLPITDAEKDTWTQVDVNHAAVSENRALHPTQSVIEGSYHNVSDLHLGNRPIITGLSSLDSTDFINVAVREIRSLLEKGSYLLHVQDVRPYHAALLQELRHMGRLSPYVAAYEADEAENETPVGFVIDRQLINVCELFRRRLGRAIMECGGFELLLNRWVTATKMLDDSEPGCVYQLGRVHELNAHEESASVVVTLAQAI